MGASSSKMEEDKALQLCRERRKFVRKALDGRCSLAAAHVLYIQSLRSTGAALRKFAEPDAPPPESSLYTTSSTAAATPEPLALTERSLSGSRRVDTTTTSTTATTEPFSFTPSPLPSSYRVHTSHMKFSQSSSTKVEEKPPEPVLGTVTSSSTPRAEEASSAWSHGGSVPPGTPPWDFFGLFHPIDHQFSSRDGDKGLSGHGYENPDDMRHLREEEGIPDLEDDESKEDSFSDSEEDEFEEPATVSLVRSFENLSRVHDNSEIGTPVTEPSLGTPDSKTQPLRRHKSTPPVVGSARSGPSEAELLNGEKSKSPNLSPLRRAESVPVETNKAQVENKVAPPKDFYSSIKEIEYLFTKASESGIELPRMLEANKFHFRPIVPGEQSGSTSASSLLKTCFSCGEDPSQVQEEPAPTEVKYLTWHRTTSSRSSSSRNPLGANSREDMEDFTGNVFENICMVSGSHASTLDRLYAWERKLYDEVKASEIIRGEYDAKRKILRQLESNGESSQKIDKTRAGVKDLHSRIRVSIHRIDAISKRIEELRDKELQPQLEELIEGLSRMWEVMSECHKRQFHIISTALFNHNNPKISVQSEMRRQVTLRLEDELAAMSSSFAKWIGSQKSYFKAINDWLTKCAPPDKDKSSKRKRRHPGPPLRNFGPPIYIVCGVWLDKVEGLLVKEVTDSIKGLAAETARLLPRQEKNSGDSGSNEGLVDLVSRFDHFRSSLASFFEQLDSFADSSVKMYADLDRAIRNAKTKYERVQSQLQSPSQSQAPPRVV